jgi:hypothetical protein
MAKFTAYFDESGTHGDSAALVVSGYVASAEQWLNFDGAWKEALADEGLTHFHMKDFAHSKKEFASWKGDEERRKRFLERLIDIIRQNVSKGFSNAVILQGYREINSKYRFQEYVGKPYAFCARICLADVDAWKEQHGYQDPILNVFEDGANDKSALVALVGRDKYTAPTFGQKREHTPLQAADFVAWENLKVFNQKEAGTLNTERLRKPFLALYSMPQEWGVYTIKNLEEICRGSNIPLRKAPPG